MSSPITIDEIKGLKDRDDPVFTITQFFERIKDWIDEYTTAEGKLESDVKSSLSMTISEEKEKPGTFDYSLIWNGTEFKTGSVRIADEDIQKALNTLKNDFEEIGHEFNLLTQHVNEKTGHALSIDENTLSLMNGETTPKSISDVELPGAIWKEATLTETTTVTTNGTSYVYSLVDSDIVFGKTVFLIGEDETAKKFLSDHYTRGTLAASGGVISFQLDEAIGTNKILYSIQKEAN